jgi:hypothetical protein
METVRPKWLLRAAKGFDEAMKVPAPLRQIIKNGRKKEFAWRYLYNFGPTVKHRLHSRTFQGEAVRVLRELNEKGIAISSVAALLNSTSLFEEMCSEVQRLEDERAAELQALRQEASNADSIGRKTFMVQLLGDYPVLNPADVFARFALQPTVLSIANAYFGMFTRLRHYNVWRTFCTPAEPRESQLWHHDREDYFILKMFVYLRDGVDGGGPFTYATRTHLKGSYKGREPEFHMENEVRRTTDDQMAAVVPTDNWVRALGPRGSIVFADTRGYHKGGLCRTSDRLMYTCMFTSQASQSQEWLQKPALAPVHDDSELAFALGGRRR